MSQKAKKATNENRSLRVDWTGNMEVEEGEYMDDEDLRATVGEETTVSRERMLRRRPRHYGSF